jgi:hypothetical protein
VAQRTRMTHTAMARRDTLLFVAFSGQAALHCQEQPPEHPC